MTVPSALTAVPAFVVPKCILLDATACPGLAPGSLAMVTQTDPMRSI